MMRDPEVYKCGGAGEGPRDYSELPLALAVEDAFGAGADPPEGKLYYDRISTRKLVTRLKPRNKVLVIYAGADEQVPLQQGFELFQAFQDARVLYDELIIPGSGHSGGRGTYGTMRTLRYFAENL